MERMIGLEFGFHVMTDEQQLKRKPSSHLL